MSTDILFLSRFNATCGVSTYTEQLSEALVDLGENVKVSAEDNERYRPSGEKSDVPCIGFWTSKRLHKGLPHLVEANPRVLHVQHEFGIFRDSSNLLELLSGFKKSRPSSKIVMTAHTVPPCFSSSDDLFLQAARLADSIIVHSDSAKKALLPHVCGIDPDRLSVIPHGMQLPVERVSKREAEKELGIGSDKDRLTVLSMGFLVRNKRHASLLQLLSTIIDRKMLVPKKLLLIIAGMPTPDNEGVQLLNQIKLAIKSYGLESNVKLVPEFIPFSRLPVFYGASDVSVRLCEKTFYSSSGGVRMDLSHGMPVAAQYAELTEDLPPHAIKRMHADVELLSFLPTVARNPEPLKKMAKAANAFAREHSWEKIAKRHQRLYEGLLSG